MHSLPIKFNFEILRTGTAQVFPAVREMRSHIVVFWQVRRTKYANAADRKSIKWRDTRIKIKCRARMQHERAYRSQVARLPLVCAPLFQPPDQPPAQEKPPPGAASAPTHRHRKIGLEYKPQNQPPVTGFKKSSHLCAVTPVGSTG